MYTAGVLKTSCPGEKTLPVCTVIELVTRLEVVRPPVRMEPRELSTFAVWIFIELTPGPAFNVWETNRELTWIEGVSMVPATILPVEICDTLSEDVKIDPVLTKAPGLKARRDPVAMILDVTRFEVRTVDVIRVFDRISVFV